MNNELPQLLHFIEKGIRAQEEVEFGRGRRSRPPWVGWPWAQCLNSLSLFSFPVPQPLRTEREDEVPILPFLQGSP